MDWFILGIQPTKDKKAITAAYREKLRQTNPEDKPEEFKALRLAYEEALAYADQADAAPVRDESPVGLWMEAVVKLYEDYSARINPKNWEKLMEDDVCIGLDTRPAAEEALLKFLLENYFLPKTVWEVLDTTFAFSQRVEELYETWPREFIDHAVISGIRLDPALDYDLFVPGVNGADCDTYRRLYFQASQVPLNEIGVLLDQMDALSERHPYGEGLRYRYLMETGHEEEGRNGFRHLAAAYPANAMLCLTWAEVCLEDGSIEEAKQLATQILDLEPKNTNAKAIYAKCLAAKEQYHEAKECAYEIMHNSSENPMLMAQTAELLKSWNEKLILQREATYAEHPADIDNMIELAWCYAQNERVDDAMALANKIDPNYEDTFAYHNLMGKLYHNTNKFAEALSHLQIVETVLRNMADDGTTETQKRMARLPEMLQIQGSCLMQLGRVEEAKEKFEQALAGAPEDVEALSVMGKILFSSGDYTAAIEVFQRLLWVSPGSWFAEMLTAMSLYQLHRDREAFDAVNRALAFQSNDLSMYLLKMQILIRNEIFEGVHEILDFLKENNAPEDLSTDFIRAELTELEKKDTRGALKQYRALQRRVEIGEDTMWKAELYYHLAVLTGNQMDLSQERYRRTVLELIDKGLDANQHDTDLLAYKAWVLKQGGLQEDAIRMYQTLAEKNPNSSVALRGLADLYYENLNLHAREALTYYEKLLEQQKTAELYFYAATCKRQLGDWDGARHYYLKELEMDPEDIAGYRGLAFIAEFHKDYEASLELLEKVFVIMDEYNMQNTWPVLHKAKILRRLGRYEEALSFVDNKARHYGYQKSLKLQFIICYQFGLLDRMKQILDRWKKENSNDPDLQRATANYYLMQGKMFKASLVMGKAKHKLTAKQVDDFKLQLNDLECNHKRAIQLLRQRVKREPENAREILNLARAYWYSGQIHAAQEAAEKALSLLDNILSQNLNDEAFYRSRRSIALAILERFEEAKHDLAIARELPLCISCSYGSCKDADIFEALIEEIMGNTEQAAKLYAAGRIKWPDDVDFVSGGARLKKKGRK